MNRATIKDSLRQQPFKPFVLRIEDGQQFRIDDPDSMAISPTQEIAVVFTVGHYHIVDTTKIVSLGILP